MVGLHNVLFNFNFFVGDGEDHCVIPYETYYSVVSADGGVSLADEWLCEGGVTCPHVCPGGQVKDVCAVCGGDNSTCLGCDGVLGSDKDYDVCGVCDGDDNCVPAVVSGTETIHMVWGLSGIDRSDVDFDDPLSDFQGAFSFFLSFFLSFFFFFLHARFFNVIFECNGATVLRFNKGGGHAPQGVSAQPLHLLFAPARCALFIGAFCGRHADLRSDL